MTRMITTYLAVILLVSLGFFGVGAIASAQELRDPMQPPAFALQKFREARMAAKTGPVRPVAAKPKPKSEPLRLTSIIFSAERKVAIINDQTLVLGDRVEGAELIGLTRDGARLRRRGKIINLQLGTELTSIRKKAAESNL